MNIPPVRFHFSTYSSLQYHIDVIIPGFVTYSESVP
jgi:hypothetical protein